MQEKDLILWKSISQFELDDPDSSFPFSLRLARDNAWTLEFSLRVIEEYKRFMFLICVSGHPLTPSDEVDQVWHLHLVYTESYWKNFCTHILKREVHHGPTKGGTAERNKFNDWYAKTLELYEQTFESKAPEDIWPSPQERFRKRNFQRIDAGKYWMIKKPF